MQVLDIRPLPNARKRAKSPHEWLKEYAELPKQPLLVVANLVTPYVGAVGERLHLDAILSYAWMESLTHPVWYTDAAVIPLPLEALSVVKGPKKERLPVWASTYLIPQGDVLRDRAYWHKRYPVDRAEFSTKLNAEMGVGRNKEYRVPLQTLHTPQMRAACIGNQSEIERLLSYVIHIGKKRSQGYGRIGSWEVTPLVWTLEEARAAISRERPMPAPFGAVGGFTPPYWYAPWHSTIANQ